MPFNVTKYSCLYTSCGRVIRLLWAGVAAVDGGLVLSLTLSKLMLASATRAAITPTVPESRGVRRRVRALLGGVALSRGINRVYRLAVSLLRGHTGPFTNLGPGSVAMSSLGGVIGECGLRGRFGLNGRVPSRRIVVRLCVHVRNVRGTGNFRLSRTVLSSIVKGCGMNSVLGIPGNITRDIRG